MYAINPVNQKRIPIFVSDYVLMGYGTGAIMAVPAHDTRDFAFARAFELPMRCVVEPTDGRGNDPAVWDDAFVSYDSKIVNSAADDISLDGMGVVEAGIILGLTGVGVAEVDATAAVFIQRMFSSYLPPIWGWATLIWMRRREYV